MTINSEPVTLVGPADPHNPLSEKRPFAEQPGSVTVQEFEDGLSYEIRVPKGGDIAGLMYQLFTICYGKVINMWDPADCGDPGDDYFYVQIWASKDAERRFGG